MPGIARDRFGRGGNSGPFNNYGRFGGQQGSNFSPSNAYSQAIPQQGQDYDEIMQGYRNQLGDPNGNQNNIMSGYRDLMNQSRTQPANLTYTDTPITRAAAYQGSEYSESPEVRNSLNTLNELQTTGGLNAQEQQDLRARGTSPIRAIYDNMSKKMDRGRSLGGGYSPSYNAASSRMAREGSEAVAGQTVNVNAGIAEAVQRGKLDASGRYASLASGENLLRNNINSENASGRNAWEAENARNISGQMMENSRNRMNTGFQNAQNQTNWAGNQGNILSGYQGAVNAQNSNNQGALQGMTSLYGTTPALVNTFGNQVMQQGNQVQNAVAQRQNYRMGGINAGRRR